MNVLEKAEKALEYLKNNEGVAKGHELQTAAGTLGRCLGALGSRQNYARHYANLLHTAIPTLLTLASNESAEVRLLGDEALNRAVAGGFAFHSYKTNIILQNQIDATKNARWIRAALSRICLGDCWLRPGIGKIRSQAQTLFPKLSQIVRTSETHLIVEALEHNLPRILNALAEYTTDEEICELSKALLAHIEHSEPATRRGIATCVAHLCAHRELLLTNVLTRVYERLWPLSQEDNAVIGWFCVIKAIFQINDVNKFKENDLFSVQDYLELYQLTINYIEQSTEHNTQNTLLECLAVLLSLAKNEYRSALLEKHPRTICLDERQCGKGHRRNISYSSAISSVTIPSVALDAREPELRFSGALQLGSALRISSLATSTDDLPIQTPDSPVSETDFHPDGEQLTRELTDRLRDYEEGGDDVITGDNLGTKINIGSSADDDVRLRYCARLLASKFLLTGNKGGIISDRIVRVSVKSSALSCLSAVTSLHPQVMTLYLDKDEDLRFQNCSGSSEGTDANADHINEYILERNVCYQDSITESLSQELLNLNTENQIFKKESLDKSIDSELKSCKDVHSNILDSKTNHLVASGLSADSTNPNMTNSNFTSNSNMTGSIDHISTGYPMSSSGDVLSSSIDLDMKFDHFGDSINSLDDIVQEKTVVTVRQVDTDKEVIENVQCFEFQHLSDIFLLLEGHGDPQIRGSVRVCVGNYLCAALELSHGDYNRWRHYNLLPKEVGETISVEKLMELVMKGAGDAVHSAVSQALGSVCALSAALSRSSHWRVLCAGVPALAALRANSYWLCRLRLAGLYEKLPYRRLFTLYPEYYSMSRQIMDTLFHLCADRDQKVRTAAAQTIASIIPNIYPTRKSTPISVMAEIYKEQSKLFSFDTNKSSLDLVRDIYFYNDLPEQLKEGNTVTNRDSLTIIIGEVMSRLMASNCKHYTQGLIETLQAICRSWPPWRQPAAYREQGVAGYCVHSLLSRGGPVAARAALLDVCRRLYPVEVHDIMCRKTKNRDIFERDTQVKEKWQHLITDVDDKTDSTTADNKVADIAEKFLQVTLKMLNIIVHLIEEVNPNVHLNKSGIALPGSPVRRRTQESLPRKSSLTEEDRKKRQVPATNLKANFSGHFYNEPFHMKLYENLRATYSNHKINLDPRSSIFYSFLSTTLDCLSIQLELATEREFGPVTEEILFYLKVIMPLCPNKTVNCVTQLLKCLFGTNMISQYSDFMSIADKVVEDTTSFYESVLLVTVTDDGDGSVSSNSSQMDSKNPKMLEEKRMLMNMENFAKNRSDRKWSNNKKELERYILLFEPVVIQALKAYTMQSDIPLQCCVLSLLCSLLSLRVNYCMLDRDQVFIGFLMKQLDYVEQHEIPNSCELVYSIMNFLVQLSSSKHHTKQLIEIPKLLQLCDGLLAAGAEEECVSGLTPVAARVFSTMSGGIILGRAQQQEAQATKEVLFYMLLKTMHLPRVCRLVCCVLSLCRERPESYYRWSCLAADRALQLLGARSLGASPRAPPALLALLDALHADVLQEQARVARLLTILFEAPPDRETSSRKLKLRYLTITVILLRKVLVLIPETEILLSINYLKSTCISPQSIFFNVKQNIDPLNVQNVNENCANLSPDVILVRFLFKTLTYAIMEMDGLEVNLEASGAEDGEQNRQMYAACVNIIVQTKNVLHLTPGCLFPLTAKTAQTILHNEQSGLNTGLYSPEENIPLDSLNRICLQLSYALPLLTVHWAHLLIRVNSLPPSYWSQLVCAPPRAEEGALRVDVLRVACVLAYCEYFAGSGPCSAVALCGVLVDGVQVVLSQRREVAALLRAALGAAPAAHALLLAAVAARCRRGLADEFALNTYKILSKCHESQSGALVILICRIIGKLEPALAIRFAKLAEERCKMLKEMSSDVINAQLSKEEVQAALELLQRDKIHIRHPGVVACVSGVLGGALGVSPLQRSQRRAVSAECARTTRTQRAWLLHHISDRCCESDSAEPKVSKYKELANLLMNLSLEELTTIMSSPEFDRKILSSCFKISCEHFTREFLNVISVQELRETEIESIRQQREAQLKEEMASSVDSNKLSVVNTIHVFKKSDNKESKSQFFIPMDNDVREKFGNLEISEDDSEIVIPEVPKLYQASLTTLDKSLADVLKLFPKQNRPLSQSENFNLSIDHSIDRYTRRCHQVFQDKLFYKEFMTIQTALTGFLDEVDKVLILIDETDCDLLEKCIDNIIGSSAARNIAMFSVVSLQYLWFLIQNKAVVEAPADPAADCVCVDHVMALTMRNVAKAFHFQEIWSELNAENYFNKTQSAISCLYAIVKYLVKDTKPLILKSHIPFKEPGPKPDIIITGNKLVTLIDYWEENFYIESNRRILGKRYKKPIESLIISLSRLELVTNIALIPPIAWSYVEVKLKNDQLEKVDIPLQPLQDMDVLEAFLFRVNLIGWSGKKQFEEVWVCLLGALHGNGPHWAVLGLAQLLLSTAPAPRGRRLHVPRAHLALGHGMQRLRNILIGTSASSIFTDVNLERIPLIHDGFDGYHQGQFSAEYLKYASDISTEASYKVRKAVKRKRKNKDIDVNSCIQLLMDLTTDMLDPKSSTGVAGRLYLIKSLEHIGAVLSLPAQWARAAALLTRVPRTAAAAALLHALAGCLAVLQGDVQEASLVHERLLKSVWSPSAAVRQAALRGWLLQLAGPRLRSDAAAALRDALRPTDQRISPHEQSLNWAVLFALVECGHVDLIRTAVDHLLAHPRHYCADLLVKGIISILRQQVLPKDLKKNIIEKLLDNMKTYSEHHAVQILMVHLFSADSKLISPRLESDVSNMDPDVLMNSMERITLLYEMLKQCRHLENKEICAAALKYFLRETLPPAATLSRVVVEYVDSCRRAQAPPPAPARVEACVLSAQIVYEVFDTSVRQDQLPVLSGWLFEALCHLLSGKISSQLVPYCLLTLLVAASDNTHIRHLHPLTYYTLRRGFHKNPLVGKEDTTRDEQLNLNDDKMDTSEDTVQAGDGVDDHWGIFGDLIRNKAMSFTDRRLLCVAALHSRYTHQQLLTLKELCRGNHYLTDLMRCLDD